MDEEFCKSRIEPFESHDDSEWWSVLSYSYVDSFFDKIYMGKIQNQNIITDYSHMFKGSLTYDLAGDIETELRIINKKEYIKFFEDELCYHLSRISRKPVTNITFNPFDVGESSVSLQDIWLNVMEPNEYNPIHNHKGVFSFVIYIDIDDEIREEYLNQKGNIYSRGFIQFLSHYTTESIEINPKNGDILIFDSRHRHMVYPYKTDNKRISIAGNINGLNLQIHS